MRTLALALAVALAGCAHFDPNHPALGTPRVDEEKPRYWIWWAAGTWHLRATAGGHGHRFQGTVAGSNGSITDLASDPRLHDQVALAGDAVQFDFESRAGAPGFDIKVAGGCLRFDLFLDGKRRPDRVRLGGHAVAVPHVPFERCP
jgi:hypothetical protein